jgi:hypothetical protein
LPSEIQEGTKVIRCVRCPQVLFVVSEAVFPGERADRDDIRRGLETFGRIEPLFRVP